MLSGLEDHKLTYCECRPLALTLLDMGLFPASPVQPSIAFSLGHLLFASKLFVHISPNISAWCSTIASNLIEKGFVPASIVSQWHDNRSLERLNSEPPATGWLPQKFFHRISTIPTGASTRERTDEQGYLVRLKRPWATEQS